MSTMPRVCLILTLLGSLAGPAAAAGLNDTGMVSCYDSAGTETGIVSGETPLPESAGFEGQDCTRGRTAADAQGVLAKTGSGLTGFDFTKIANNGSVLVAGAILGNNPTDWACTRDNHTGLMWEVKQTSSTRDGRYTYTWRNEDAAINGGDPGSSVGGSCVFISPCDTARFVAEVNSDALCGYSDWRLPTVQELQSIVSYQAALPSQSANVDENFLPNLHESTTRLAHWSGSSFAANSAKAWTVNFYASSGQQGQLKGELKTLARQVILVRDAP